MISQKMVNIIMRNHDKKVLTLLVGESGCGKTSIANFVAQNFDMKVLESYTTRPPRFEGEKGHIFISEEEFEALEDKVAYTEFDGYKYCATKEQVENSDIYIIDPDGIETLKQYKEKYGLNKELLTIYLYASVYVRAARMEIRGDDDETIGARITNDVKKFDNLQYTFAVTNNLNDTIEKAGLQIYHLMSMAELDHYYQGEKKCMIKLP